MKPDAHTLFLIVVISLQIVHANESRGQRPNFPIRNQQQSSTARRTPSPPTTAIRRDGTVDPNYGDDGLSLRSRSLVNRMGQDFNRSTSPSSFASLASIPYMFGDSSGGGCGTFEVGGTTAVTIGHPTNGCSRLNISESNSPVVANRAYLSYRHFRNASEVDIFSRSPLGGRNSVDIDVMTFGFERKISENISLEARLPVTRQLGSDLFISRTTGPVVSLPLDDTDISIGNLGLILKLALYYNDRSYWSSGVAANLPTAPDVHLTAIQNDDQYRVVDPSTGQPVSPPFPFHSLIDFSGTNDTVNLSAFLSGVHNFSDSFYTVGFLQFDVPLNPSEIRLNGFTIANGIPVAQFDFTDDLDQQVLMRVNAGFGKRLWNDPCGRHCIRSLTLVGEMHYSTTLNDADIAGPVVVSPDLGTGVGAIRVGNSANRIDSLNALLGVHCGIGKTIFSHGFAAPIRDGADRGFDFEYNFSVNHLF